MLLGGPTEHVAGGQTGRFQNVRGRSLHNILTFQKTRGQELTGGANALPAPPE